MTAIVWRLFLFGVLGAGGFACRLPAAEAARAEALLIIVADQHSAYERAAQLVARIDRLRAENPGVPCAILVNGDAFEYGNAVARRTAGAVDFALFAALARRAPTIVNLGNHEPEFFDVVPTVAKFQAAGVTVIAGGNLRDRATGLAFAPPSTRLKLGEREAVVVGLVTNQLNTFRVALRPSLDLADPAVWARENFPTLLKDTALPIVLSHSELRSDREVLARVPDGTLFAGAHEHLRFVHRQGRTVYFHSGSWMEFVSVARLRRTPVGLGWDVEQQPLRESDPVDPALAALVRETLAQHLTPEETAVVGRTARALGPSEASSFAVEAARAAAQADAAMIGGTTFGAGLPAGEVSRFALDACVRFDGALWMAEVEGAWLKNFLARTNQGPDAPFAERRGENLVAVAPAVIEPARRYRFVTSDWVAKNLRTYFGDDAPTLKELPGLRLKAAVIAALAPVK